MPSCFRVVAMAAFFAGFSAAAHAQGGPPMLTDDPGTPGPGRWELNFSSIIQRGAGSRDVELPYLDLNYGVGDRIQLTWQVYWDSSRPEGGSRENGLGASVAGLKWRFLDSGDGGWQIAIFPQATFLNPGSDSDRRGLASRDPGLLVPFEIEKDLGPVSANLEFGRVLAPQGRADLAGVGGGWIAGLAVGREVARGVECDAEIHVDTGPNPAMAEWIAAAGTRIGTSKDTTVLFSVGRDARNTLSARTSMLLYIGFQVRL
jgi:hypothetical protein